MRKSVTILLMKNLKIESNKKTGRCSIEGRMLQNKQPIN